LALDKRLPSPPVAQIVDPNSPPKACRTLVDAEAGNPSIEQWPIIQPEAASSTQDVSLTEDASSLQDIIFTKDASSVQGAPSVHDASSTQGIFSTSVTSSTQDAISVKDGSTAKEASTIKDASATQNAFSTTDVSITKDDSSARDTTTTDIAANVAGHHVQQQQPRSVSEGGVSRDEANIITQNRILASVAAPGTSTKFRTLSSRNPYAKSVNDALTLAVPSKSRVSNAIPVPPRNSSKRNSLPFRTRFEVNGLSDLVQTIIETKAKTELPTTPTAGQLSGARESRKVDTIGRVEPEEDAAKLIEAKQKKQEQKMDGGGPSSYFEWSSSDDEGMRTILPENVFEKRQLYVSRNTGSGPTLTKAVGAHGAITGQIDGRADLVHLKYTFVDEDNQINMENYRPWGPNKYPAGVSTPTPGHAATPVKSGDAKPVIISPIRSMKPSRTISSQTSPITPSSPTHLGPEAKATTRKPVTTPTAANRLSTSSQETSMTSRATQKRLAPSWMSPTVSSMAKAEPGDRISPAPLARASNGEVEVDKHASVTVNGLRFSILPMKGKSAVKTGGVVPAAEGVGPVAPAKKIMTKRSFRTLFKREKNSTEVLPKITEAGNSLAKRISQNFSKASLSSAARMKTVKKQHQPVAAGAEPLAEVVVNPAPAALDLAAMLTSIVKYIESLPGSSPQRLAGVQASEALLLAWESAKSAEISEEEARKHARDAELHAEQARLALNRVWTLLRPQ
jgi:hypothetical protein